MLGFLHVIAVEAGAKIPTEECLAAPTGLIASLESMPTFGWLQIMLFCCMQETGAGSESSFFSLAKYEGYGAVGDREAGDIANIGWGRYDDPEVMEIKHGRAAMLGFLHVIAVEAGAKIPTEECLAAPTGMIASLESMPTFGWLQIMVFCCMQETGAGNESSFFSLAKAQTVDSEAGDIAGIGWVRYDDPEAKTFKLNAERQNGRAAMLGITGCLLHELLGVDALYPTGGLGGAAPPTIF